jgi:oligosaccharide reducing-end xylanase
MALGVAFVLIFVLGVAGCSDSTSPSRDSSGILSSIGASSDASDAGTSSAVSSAATSSSAGLSSAIVPHSFAVLSSSSAAGSSVVLPGGVVGAAVDTTGWSQADNVLKVAPWQGFARGAWSITFDDGFSSQTRFAKPLLDQYGLKATFFPIAGSMNGGWRFGTWAQYIALQAEGHEIGSHTVTHRDLATLVQDTVAWELQASLDSLNLHIPGHQLRTMATPYTTTSAAIKTEGAARYLVTRLGGGAIGQDPSTWTSMGGLLASFAATRTPQDDAFKMQQLRSTIQYYSIDQGLWNTHIIHEVVPRDTVDAIKGSSYHPIPTEEFGPYLAWLAAQQAAGELWVAPMGTVARYALERRLLKLGTLANSATEVQFVLEDGLDDAEFDVALSLEWTPPAGWTRASVTQGARTINAQATAGGTLRFDALPNGVPIVLTKL